MKLDIIITLLTLFLLSCMLPIQGCTSKSGQALELLKQRKFEIVITTYAVEPTCTLWVQAACESLFAHASYMQVLNLCPESPGSYKVREAVTSVLIKQGQPRFTRAMKQAAAIAERLEQDGKKIGDLKQIDLLQALMNRFYNRSLNQGADNAQAKAVQKLRTEFNGLEHVGYVDAARVLVDALDHLELSAQRLKAADDLIDPTYSREYGLDPLVMAIRTQLSEFRGELDTYRSKASRAQELFQGANKYCVDAYVASRYLSSSPAMSSEVGGILAGKTPVVNLNLSASELLDDWNEQSARASATVTSVKIKEQKGTAICEVFYPVVNSGQSTVDEAINRAIVAEIVGSDGGAKGQSVKASVLAWLATVDTTAHMGWSNTRQVKVVFNNMGTLTTEGYYEEDSGGAHPNYGIVYSNYSLNTGKKLLLSELLVPDCQTKLDKLGEAAFRKEQKIPAGQSLTDAGYRFEAGTFHCPSNYAIQDTALLFQFQPYEIGGFQSPSFTITYYALLDEHLVNENGPLGWIPGE